MTCARTNLELRGWEAPRCPRPAADTAAGQAVAAACSAAPRCRAPRQLAASPPPPGMEGFELGLTRDGRVDPDQVTGLFPSSFYLSFLFTFLKNNFLKIILTLMDLEYEFQILHHFLKTFLGLWAANHGLQHKPRL